MGFWNWRWRITQKKKSIDTVHLQNDFIISKKTSGKIKIKEQTESMNIKRQRKMKNNFLSKVVLSALFSMGSICGFNDLFAQQITYDIREYGAKGDGKSMNTESIQATIDAASKNGGGKVLIPKGSFVSGSIILKSNIDLHIEEGGVLLGSLEPRDYRKLNRWKSFILADSQENISISGKGEINGRGRIVALNADSLHHAGIDIDPSYNMKRMRPGESKRPQLIEFVKCKNSTVRNVTLRNAATWVQTYDQCEDLVIDGITVDSDAYWNNDGIDISDCKNVRIVNSNINSADDGICLKSHTAGKINENIYIGNCTVRSSASAIKFGTASTGGFKNVTVENIKVYDTFRSAIALESVDGGILEDVVIRNIDARNTGNAIFIRLGHRNVDGAVGTLKNISIKNVKVQVPFDRPDAEYDLRGPELPFFHNPFPASVAGIPGHNVENVTLEDIEITYPGRSNNGLVYKSIYFLDNIPENESAYPEFHMFGELPAWGMFVRHVRGLDMKNITFKLKEKDFRSAIVFDDVEGLKMENITLDDLGGQHPLVGRNLKNASLKSIKIKNQKLDNIKCIENCEDIVVE